MKRKLVLSFILAASLIFGCGVAYTAFGESASTETEPKDSLTTGNPNSETTPDISGEETLLDIDLTDLFQAVTVAGGPNQAVAVRSDGTVWGWGCDYGTSHRGLIRSGKPVQIEGLTDIVRVSAGYCASAAIKSDGTLWLWGSGWIFWRGAFESYPLTLDQPYMSDVADVSVGEHKIYILKNDGSVYVLGSNAYLSREEQMTFRKVEGLPKIKKLAQGFSDAAFVDEDGDVWFYDRKPRKVEGLSDIIDIKGAAEHYVALKSDGTVYNFSLDEITFVESLNKEIATFNISQVEGLSDIAAIASGNRFSLAQKRDGTVWSWGKHSYSLGDGKTFESDKPIKLPLPVKATGVEAGYGFAIIITPYGLLSWGDNSIGQLGYGFMPKNPQFNAGHRYTPGPVKIADIIDENNYDDDDELIYDTETEYRD